MIQQAAKRNCHDTTNNLKNDKKGDAFAVM